MLCFSLIWDAYLSVGFVLWWPCLGMCVCRVVIFLPMAGCHDSGETDRNHILAVSLKWAVVI